MSDADIRNALKAALTREILHDPDYPLQDDEPLISSGLVDSFSLLDVSLWVEQTYGVHLDETELNADVFDTVNQLTELIEQRL